MGFSLSAGATLDSSGIPKNSVIQHEAAIRAAGFLVMAHGTSAEAARAKAVLGTIKPEQHDVHAGVQATVPALGPAPAGD